MTDGDTCFGERKQRGAWECWLGSGGFKSGLEKGLTEKALTKTKRQCLSSGPLNRGDPKAGVEGACLVSLRICRQASVAGAE